ncbi:MAG: hypothetical protein ACYTDU_20955 [Planctomycetota bacterium]|jgi:hypothetical protein
MRIFFVASLALVLVALPATQAAACRCVEEGPAEGAVATCSCCEPTAGSCCCGSEDEGSTQQLQQDCACSMRLPQTSEPPVIQLPMPVAGTEVVLAEPVTHPNAGQERVFDVRGDPHPEVVLPLLL